MIRSMWPYYLITVVALMAVEGFHANCSAEEAKTPAGLRVAYTLMSNGAEMEAIVKAASISGHKQANAPYFGTWHGYVGGGRDGIPKKAQDLLAAGEIDALTVATWTWSPNLETWRKHIEMDSALAGTAELGLKKNPNFRLCWRAFLKPHTVKKDKAVIPDFAQTKKALELETKELKTHVDLVNKMLGKRVVLIVPHAQAGLALVDLVAEGKFPGVKDPAELWMKEEPFNMNVHRHLRALAAYCDFAVIYGISPEGLKPSFKGITYKSKGGPNHSMEGITDEQHAILQKIAWETVSRFPQSGLASEDGRAVKNSVGMTLVSIPPGKFTMGSPETENGRETQETPHEVALTKGFSMSAHEVTVGQFKQFVAATKFQTDGERDGKGAYGIDEAGKIEKMDAKITWRSPGFEQTDEHPVVNVSWSDARAFCKWLSEKEKKTYRLPTEAEWEYACRAGTQTAYTHGDDPEGLVIMGNGADATARARFPRWSIGIKGKDGHVFTAPVGQFKANGFGLYDMHGNVWEWCEDWYVPNSYPKEKQTDPTGPKTGKAKVQRGGGWSSDAKRLRCAARIGRDASAYRGCYQGFRVVLQQAEQQSAAVKK